MDIRCDADNFQLDAKNLLQPILNASATNIYTFGIEDVYFYHATLVKLSIANCS